MCKIESENEKVCRGEMGGPRWQVPPPLSGDSRDEEKALELLRFILDSDTLSYTISSTTTTRLEGLAKVTSSVESNSILQDFVGST